MSKPFKWAMIVGMAGETTSCSTAVTIMATRSAPGHPPPARDGRRVRLATVSVGFRLGVDTRILHVPQFLSIFRRFV